MIYQINNKYYIRVAPSIYTEISFILKNDDVIIKPTSNKIEVNSGAEIKQLDFQKEKVKIKQNLQEENNIENATIVPRNNKYRKRA